MIKPESLWSLCKSCPDSKWIGDIMRALGGQEVTLDFGQKQMLTTIQSDSQWMDEHFEKKRERERQRMKAYRETKKKPGETDVARCNALSQLQTDVARCNALSQLQTDVAHPTSLPPSLPTSLPTKSVRDISAPARTPARRDVPTCEAVVSACEVTGVPTWYAKWWHAEMAARDWTKVDGSPVSNRNWRPVLKSWWNRDAKNAAHLQELRAEHEPKVVVRKTYRPEDWVLCAERCGNFCDGRCAKGVAVPKKNFREGRKNFGSRVTN